MKKNKLFRIIIIIVFIILTLFVVSYSYSYPKYSENLMIFEIKSPNGDNTAKVYHKLNGATVPNMLLIKICSNHNKCRIIYYNKERIDDFIKNEDESYSLNFKWIDDDKILINNYIIDIKDGIYDFRRKNNKYKVE